jgi:hypothetical protein
MKQNFRWGFHIVQQIKDFVPLYNFLKVLEERMNKALKDKNKNGWKGCPLEISMMRAYNCAMSVQTWYIYFYTIYSNSYTLVHL